MEGVGLAWEGGGGGVEWWDSRSHAREASGITAPVTWRVTPQPPGEGSRY